MAQSETGHVWDLIKDSHAALLITHDDSGMDARPMATTVRREEGAIYILANKNEGSERQIHLDHDVVLSFQNGASFVVVYGGAALSDDRQKIAELWSGFDKAWWNGPDDPRIRLITVTPDRAEYWESPGRLISYACMLVSAAMGKQPNPGEHRQIRL